MNTPVPASAFEAGSSAARAVVQRPINKECPVGGVPNDPSAFPVAVRAGGDSDG